MQSETDACCIRGNWENLSCRWGACREVGVDNDSSFVYNGPSWWLKNKEASVGLLTVLTLTEPWAHNSKTKTFISATWRFSSWNGSGRHQAAWNDQHSLHALRHSSDIWKFLLNEAALKSRVTCTKEETLPHYSHCWTHKTATLLQMIFCHFR